MAQCEPDEWFVVFHRTTTRWWLDWLAFGRYKHVSLCGFVARSDSWVMINYMVGQNRVFVVSDREAPAALEWFVGDNDVLVMPAGDRSGEVQIRLALPGLWCVPSTAHILGLKSCALRPDGLFRQCLAKGGRPLGALIDVSPSEGRSGDRAPEA